ncbi:MAG: DUF3570 domain-containing protein [Polyangia bacterium]
MQLSRTCFRAPVLVALVVGPVVLGQARAVGAAEVEAAQRVTVFREASASRTGLCAQGGACDLTVTHPQTDVGATFGSGVGLAAGYAVDIVSGATPKVFSVDAVSTATKFSDVRHQIHGGLSYSRPIAELSGSVSYGWESDYKSTAVTVTTRSDVLDHQVTLALAYTHNFDRVCDQNNDQAAGRPLERLALPSSQNCFKSTAGPLSAQTATRSLNIDALEPTITWAVTPRLLVLGGATVQVLDGFQSNPYRQVELGSSARTPQESLPSLRQRFALFGRAAYGFPHTRTSLQAMGRLYRDTWGVDAATGELVANQYLAKYLLFSARGRVHAQRGAIFYRDALAYRLQGPNSLFWTGDRELSPMENILFGGKLAYLRIPEAGTTSFFSDLEFAAKWETLLYYLGSSSAPNSDRKLATILQLAVSCRF